MKIVLIQPKAYKHAPTHVTEPLDLGYLASYVRERGYSDIQIRLSAFESEEDIVADASQADIVGITATSPMMTNARMIAKKIKRKNRNSIIVFGGIHVSALPESTMKDENIDIVVRGEGEVTFHELVVAVEKSLPLKEIDGISYRENALVIHNSNRSRIENLNVIPFPARDLMFHRLPVNKNQFEGKKAATIISSRGCPFNCTYCASRTVWEQKCLMRSAENVVAEIKELKNIYQIEHIYFNDDTFTVDRARVARFCDLLIEANIGVTWGCNVHASTGDKDLFRKMKMAGCVQVWIGVESGSALILRELKKGVSLERIKSVFNWTRAVGLKRSAYLMLGAYGESLETIQETEELINEIKPDMMFLTIFTPYPGCEEYGYAREKGYVWDNMDWSEIDLHFSVIMPTRYLTKKEVAVEHTRLSKKLGIYKRKGEINFPLLIRLVITKIKKASFLEYPALVRKFWYFIRISR